MFRSSLGVDALIEEPGTPSANPADAAEKDKCSGITEPLVRPSVPGLISIDVDTSGIAVKADFRELFGEVRRSKLDKLVEAMDCARDWGEERCFSINV